MTETSWAITALPLIPLFFGVIGYFWFRHESRVLDRKFGRDSPPKRD